MDIEQPDGMRAILFDHQLASAYSLEHRERVKKVSTGALSIETTVGVFADKAGYGKTLSMLAVILRDRMPWDLETPHAKTVPAYEDRNAAIVARRAAPAGEAKCNATLIVTHGDVQDQWEAELGRTTLRFFRVDRKTDLRRVDPDRYDVVLCPHTQYQHLTSEVARVWKRLVFDEPETAPIPAMSHVDAGFTWFVTSQPSLLLDKFRTTREDARHWLRSLFGRMPRDVFGRLVVKNDDGFVAQSYAIRQPDRIIHKCLRPPIINVLGDAVSPDVRDMLGADDVAGALAALGGAAQSNATLVDLALRPIEAKIAGLAGAEPPSDEAGLSELARLRRLHADVTSRFDGMRRGLCTICWTAPMVDPVFVPCCQNMFGGACLLRWLKDRTTCPLCRAPGCEKNMVRVAPEPPRSGGGARPGPRPDPDCKLSDGASAPRKTKGDVILDIIQARAGGSFILYSKYGASFNANKAILKGAEIPFVEIRGAHDDRRQKIEQYRTGGVRVLLLSTKQPGAGMGFENTSDIILYHAVEPSV